MLPTLKFTSGLLIQHTSIICDDRFTHEHIIQIFRFLAPYCRPHLHEKLVVSNWKFTLPLLCSKESKLPTQTHDEARLFLNTCRLEFCLDSDNDQHAYVDHILKLLTETPVVAWTSKLSNKTIVEAFPFYGLLLTDKFKDLEKCLDSNEVCHTS